MMGAFVRPRVRQTAPTSPVEVDLTQEWIPEDLVNGKSCNDLVPSGNKP